jgi:hypothetical protein
MTVLDRGVRAFRDGSRGVALPPPSPRAWLTAIGIAVAVVVWITFAQIGGNPVDAWGYWLGPDNPYGRDQFPFVYPPPFALLMIVLRQMPFEVFTALLRALELAGIVVLAGPATAIALFLPPVATEINAANINVLLGLCIVFGLRWPILYVPVLLTKPTAAIGLVWFVARKDWRALILVGGVTAAICAVSFLTAPDLWASWVAQLRTISPRPGWPYPFTLAERAVIFVPLVIWGAWTRRRWAVVLASLLAFPLLTFLSPTLLLALLPVLRLKNNQGREPLPAAAA